MLTLLGVDPSINGSGFCLMTINDDYTINHVKLFGFTGTKKWIYKSADLEINPLPDGYENYPYHYRAQLIYDAVKNSLGIIDYIAIEDYAMGGSGRVFNIAEFTGSLKDIFYRQRIPMKTLPPTSVKSFATSNGGADKILMGMHFKASPIAKKVDQHLFELPEYSSPQADIVDAVAIVEMIRCELCWKATGKFPSDMNVKEQGAMESIVTGKKNASSQPTIVHPWIIFGESYKTPKKPKKEKKIKEPKVIKEKKPKKAK